MGKLLNRGMPQKTTLKMMTETLFVFSQNSCVGFLCKAIPFTLACQWPGTEGSVAIQDDVVKEYRVQLKFGWATEEVFHP